jgi:hypothetical protein
MNVDLENLKCKMLQTIKLRWINEKLSIGMVNWKEVYIFFRKERVFNKRGNS